MNGELRFGLLCLNCVNRFVCGIGKGEFAIRSMVQHFPQPAAMNVLVKHSATMKLNIVSWAQFVKVSKSHAGVFAGSGKTHR